MKKPVGGWWKFLKNAFLVDRAQDLVERIQKVDRQNREIRHDLRNVQANTEAVKPLLELLIKRMREDNHG